MKQIITIIATLISISTFSQEFEKTLINYRLFEEKITVINKSTFQFGDKIMFVNYTADSLKDIFISGIIYPDIFNEFKPNKNLRTTTDATDSSIVVIKVNKDLFYLFYNCDSLTITDFKEIGNSNKSSTIRKFEFLLFRLKLMNPTIYTIELTNDKATKQTDIETFIKSARLTRLLKGSILI